MPATVAAHPPHKLRVVFMGVHGDPGCSCWMMVHLVCAERMVPVPPLAPTESWMGPYFDLARIAGEEATDPPELPFPVVLVRYETLGILHAILMLTGLEEVATHCYHAMIHTDHQKTHVRLTASRGEEGGLLLGLGPRAIVVEDPEWGFRLAHERPRHMDLSPIMPLKGVHIVMCCPLCHRPGVAVVFPHDRPFCPRCGGSVLSIWTPGEDDETRIVQITITTRSRT